MNYDLDAFVGKTVTSIQDANFEAEGVDQLLDKDRIHFTCSDGSIFKMYHYQDCCEWVSVEDISGSLSDLLNTPILFAYCETNSDSNCVESKEYEDDCVLWTFYRFGTVKGTVVIRWYGTSNGYYGVEVNFEKVTQEEDYN